MEQSPLTLQTRPDVFEPKIVQLYQQLFQDTEYAEEKSEGFWRELFLLRPDSPRLSGLLDDLEPGYLLHINHTCQDLLRQCVITAKESRSPSDEHALETLAIFLDRVLSKRYQSPSADIIEILAGLDHVDTVFTELVDALYFAMANGRTASIKSQAVKVALIVTSGGFNTSLLTYFTQRDLFPALLKLVREEGPVDLGVQALVLCGILANCNKFELYNPYQAKILTVIDLSALGSLSDCVGHACSTVRDRYTAIQDDTPAAWSIGGALSYVGLGAVAGIKSPPPTPTDDVAKLLFAELPDVQAAILLALYEFVLHNKQFILSFIGSKQDQKDSTSGFEGFCSMSSYLLHHSHRSDRAALYTRSALHSMLIIVEEASAMKSLCEPCGEVRLCRQRAPFLPVVKGPRSLTAVIMDVCVDAINHNLRTRIDAQLYFSVMGILLRITTYLKRTRTRITYHWPELWKSVFAFVHFLTAYHDSLKSVHGHNEIVYALINLIALCLTSAEAFLPDGEALDDLFYKACQAHADLEQLRDLNGLDRSPVATNIKTLSDASTHLTEAIQKAGGNSKKVSVKEVMIIIKNGYETLSIETKEEGEYWSPYREQDHKADMKKITRVVIADGKRLGASHA